MPKPSQETCPVGLGMKIRLLVIDAGSGWERRFGIPCNDGEL